MEPSDRFRKVGRALVVPVGGFAAALILTIVARVWTGSWPPLSRVFAVLLMQVFLVWAIMGGRQRPAFLLFGAAQAIICQYALSHGW